MANNYSEILKIIEAGMECDKKKLIAYAKLLADKTENNRFKIAIEDRISDRYKNKPVVVIKQLGSGGKDK